MSIIVDSGKRFPDNAIINKKRKGDFFMKLNKKFMLLGVAGVAALGLASCGEKTVTGTYDLKVWAPEAALELTKKQVEDFANQ